MSILSNFCRQNHDAKKAIDTVKAVFKQLKIIRKAYRQKHRGYREQIYATLQSAQQLIVDLEKNKLEHSIFLKTIQDKKSKFSTEKISLSTEVVALAFGATSRRARKNAWKRGQALDYLRKKGISVPKTAIILKKWGGVEKVAKLAHKRLLTKIEAVKKEAVKDKGQKQRDGKSNDAEIKVTVRMKLSARDEIEEQPVGSIVNLTARRMGQKGADLKIIKMKLAKDLHVDEADDEDDSDW
jgi:hypothetical protein